MIQYKESEYKFRVQAKLGVKVYLQLSVILSRCMYFAESDKSKINKLILNSLKDHNLKANGLKAII